MKTFLVVAFAVFLLVSCESRHDTITVRAVGATIPSTPIKDREYINGLLEKVIERGDSQAYNEVASYYLLENMEAELFYYSFVMANKYDNGEAAFHMYYIIANSTPGRPKEALAKMDKRTRSLALYYLLKSYERGFGDARYSVEDIFGDKAVAPKSSSYLQALADD